MFKIFNMLIIIKEPFEIYSISELFSKFTYCVIFVTPYFSKLFLCHPNGAGAILVSPLFAILSTYQNKVKGIIDPIYPSVKLSVYHRAAVSVYPFFCVCVLCSICLSKHPAECVDLQQEFDWQIGAI